MGTCGRVQVVLTRTRDAHRELFSTRIDYIGGTDMGRLRTCPRCKQVFDEVPAKSRLDNTTLVCPECGRWEALYEFKAWSRGLPVALPDFFRGCDDSPLEGSEWWRNN